MPCELRVSRRDKMSRARQIRRGARFEYSVLWEDDSVREDETAERAWVVERRERVSHFQCPLVLSPSLLPSGPLPFISLHRNSFSLVTVFFPHFFGLPYSEIFFGFRLSLPQPSLFTPSWILRPPHAPLFNCSSPHPRPTTTSLLLNMASLTTPSCILQHVKAYRPDHLATEATGRLLNPSLYLPVYLDGSHVWIWGARGMASSATS